MNSGHNEQWQTWWYSGLMALELSTRNDLHSGGLSQAPRDGVNSSCLLLAPGHPAVQKHPILGVDKWLSLQWEKFSCVCVENRIGLDLARHDATQYEVTNKGVPKSQQPEHCESAAVC